MEANGIVTLLTDFGSRDTYVGVMRGVILAIAPAARLVDLTHEVPPQDVFVGAMLLASAVDYFPAGTVHLAVVDPGVGSARSPVMVVTERAFLVGPDNGLLRPAVERLGVCEVRRLDRDRFFLKPTSRTFHGRDVFAPVAAHLAAGLEPAALGSRQPSLETLAIPAVRREADVVYGEVLHVDHYGNLVTNIDATAVASFPGDRLSVTIGDVSVTSLSPAYAAAREGDLLAIIGSWETLEIAVRGGNAAERLGAGRGTAVVLTARR